VTPNFFRVMGIPVIAGRSFDAEIPDGIVVSQTLASRIVESGSPIGRIVIVGDVAKQIVGVAADADLLGAFIRGDFSRTRPAVYEPLAAPSGAARVLVRRSRPDQIEALSARARLADPEGIIDVRPLTAARDARLGDARVAAGLAGMVGLAALTIAAVGLVGVFGYVARQRQRDIGIHLALGAPQSAVFRRVFGSSLRALAIGVCAGLAGGALAMPLLKGYVNPRVSAFDPATLAAVGLVLAAVAILAMFVPARAAMRVNPVTALRSD
jgi:hypothetical protein